MNKQAIFILSLLIAAPGIKPALCGAETATLPTVTVTAPGTIGESALVGPYNQPEWTQNRRFTTTRVYIQQEPWNVGVEQWYRVRHYRDGTTKQLFEEEIEIGLPHRMQLDIYWDWTNEGGTTSNKDLAVELRWALADWGVIPLNPTLYAEYKFTNPDFGGDVFEVKLLLGDEITHDLHWGLNLVYEREISGELANEFAVTQGLSYTLIDQVLSAGVEMQFKYENVAGDRSNGEKKFQIGPSIQWRPTNKTHIDLVGLFGCTNDSPSFEGYLVFGIDLGGAKKEKKDYTPVSGLRGS
ncbi:MAG: transporter [Verrucomicrobia bacterium]|nr:transporter [Verrucomicrobiota bacterium]